jgi:transposase-like protein/IS1 family transposase
VPAAEGSTPSRSNSLRPTPRIALTIRRAHPQTEAKRTRFLGPPSFWLTGLKEARANMTCHNCRIECNKFGKDRNGYQRFRCRQCSRTFTEPHNGHFFGMYTPSEKTALILKMLVEGVSVRSVERLTGVHRDTILRLLVLAGERCEQLLESRIRQISVRDVQCDEIWGFVGCKEKNNVDDDPARGDAYCFVALERNSKLIVTWQLGRRTTRDTVAFTEKINEGTKGHFQITTDGFSPYVDAIHYSLGTRVDFAQLVKEYAASGDADHRYSPAEVVRATAVPRWGRPNSQRICTSHIESQNLTMRMAIRRLTRLTNAFSKKWKNLKAALALHFACYNFCRVHSTLRITPAMEAGPTDHVWNAEELLATQI